MKNPFKNWFGGKPSSAGQKVKEDAKAVEEFNLNDVMLGGGLGSLAALQSPEGRPARSRTEIYGKWDQMAGYSVVSSALKLQCTAALGGHSTTGDVVFIEKKPAAAQNKQMAYMVEQISADLMPVLNAIAYQVAFTGAAYGDAYGRLYADRRGVTDIRVDEMLHPMVVMPYERASRTVGFAVFTGENNFDRLSINQVARMKMPRVPYVPQTGLVQRAYQTSLTEDDLSKLPVLPSSIGGSLLYNAESAYDALVATITGLLGQRWMNALDERFLTVNLEGLTKARRDTFLGSIKLMLELSKSIKANAVKTGRAPTDPVTHVMPVWNDKQMVNITPASSGLQGGGLGVEDVIFSAQLLAGALGTDLSMLGFANLLSGGLGEGGFFRTSAQAAENSRHLRGALGGFFNWVIDVHTLNRYKIVFRESERPWQVNFYGQISALAAEEQSTRAEGTNAALLFVQAVQQFKDFGASPEDMQMFMSKMLKIDEDMAKQFSRIAGGNEGPEATQ